MYEVPTRFEKRAASGVDADFELLLPLLGMNTAITILQ